MTDNLDQKLGLIFGRRSIRAYTPEPITDEALRKLLEAAMAAPSAAGKDPWRFVVVKSREKLKKIADALPPWELSFAATWRPRMTNNSATFYRIVRRQSRTCSCARI
jgi:nitroreductase